MTAWIDALLQGALLGALYGLFATGLSIVFGIMRVVNVAHGDLIVLCAFMALLLQKALGITSPLLTLVILIPLMFAVGYALQRLLLNRTLGSDSLRPVLVTFGLSVIIQNALLEAFSADSQRLQIGAISTASIPLFECIAVGVFPLLTLAVSVGMVAALQWMLTRSALGRAFRATSDDGATARLMGIDDKRVFAAATGIAFAVMAVAGVLAGIRSSFDPASGPENLLFAFEAVIMGGLGSLWGTLAGGVILGIAQSVGARISPDAQVLTGHIVFILVLMIRPGGLFPRRGD
jgi:branched-chain amino acid transport system permease protein